MNRDTKILIVGAGVAGAVLALALERAGFTPDVIELRPKVKEDQSSITLQGPGIAVAQKLGIATKVRSLGSDLTSYTIYNQQNQRLKQLEISKGAYEGVTAPRSFFVQNYLEALERTAVLYEERVKAFKRLSQGIQVTFASGKIAVYDLVIGADGVHSQTRQHFFPNSKEYYTGALLVGLRMPRSMPLESIHAIKEYWGSSAMFGIYGMKTTTRTNENALAFCLDAPNIPNEKLSRASIENLLRDKFKSFKVPVIQEVLNNLPAKEALYTSFMTNVPAKNSWFNERVCLVGDAAHAILPSAGMGASLASIGAYKLAQALAHCETPSAAFQQYRQSHLPYATKIQDEGLMILKVLRVPPLLASMRNLLLRLTPQRYLLDRFLDAGQNDLPMLTTASA